MRTQSVIYNTLNHFLNDAVKGILIPIIYLDTNVLLDIIDKRCNDSLDLYRYIWDHQWQCVTSIFAKVEILEVKQIQKFNIEKRQFNWSSNRMKKELYKRDLSPNVLSNISRNITARMKSRCKGIKKYSCLIEDGWIKAEEIKRKTNLTDKDSIHLAEALAIACDIFLTRDDFLLSVAKRYIWAETPNSLSGILKSVDNQI